MNISNRSLVLLLVVTVVLVAAAAAITLKTAPKPLVVEDVAPGVQEMDVLPEVHRSGGLQPDTVLSTGPLTAKVDAATDTRSATLSCGDMLRAERPVFEGGVAFEGVPFGNCTLVLNGAATAYGPVYPGDELECTVIDGRTSCTGGLAIAKAGTVSFKSTLPGQLLIDGESKGPLPVEAVKVPVGTRVVAVHLDDGRTMKWNLVVQPDEVIKVLFPDPKPTGASHPASPAVPAPQ